MKTQTVRAIVERADKNFSAYLDGIDGVVVTGNTFDEVKNNMLQAIDDFIKVCNEYGYEIPDELKGEYEIMFRMDVKSVLEFYSGIFTNSGLERITGINQKQLWHYASGMSNPRPEQALKLESALHKLGQELLSINL